MSIIRKEMYWVSLTDHTVIKLMVFLTRVFPPRRIKTQHLPGVLR